MTTVRELDKNGYLTVPGCPISSFGIFQYSAAQLGLDGDPGRIVNVYRPESAVSDPAALASFKDVPLINDHEMLQGAPTDTGDASRTAPEDYGVSGVLTGNVYYEAPWMRGDLKIFARDMQEDLTSGKKDLSLGYSCDFVVQSGTFDGKDYEVIQTNLRGNHIALVGEGRVPGARVLDGLCFDHLSFDAIPSKKENEMVKKASTAADNAVEQLQSLLPALQQFLKQEATEPAHQEPAASETAEQDDGTNDPLAAEVPEAPAADPAAEATDPNATGGDCPPGLPGIIQTIETLLGQLKAMAPSAPAADEDEPDAGEGTDEEDIPQCVKDEDEGKAAGPVEGQGKAPPGPTAGKHESADAAVRRVYADIAAKARLYDRVSAFAGAFDHAAMDARQVAAYGVKKLGIACKKGMETVALDAYLTGREKAQAENRKTAATIAADAAEVSTGMAAYLKGK